ncbi:Uncharacterised protein [Klebsiella pneumoniae]|nr:Uncharacterised protein [Klebsiella pneumoniae]STU25646.1 Uncharacterised protein [Klebsiella pneumoniae]STU29739.1 Uncharacterised protein [Klebsiella pneumoniae]STU30306.1 Uncharacterised protein [Klebsiella pneumoniae]STW34172.1 Uncharacterised protein [Klebsiella pneumoniae]
MTTDITELAKSLKAAANTTADAIDRLKAFPGDEIIDLSQHEDEQIDIDITTINEWYELSSPANILALVEVLEKAQAKADVYDMLRDDYGLREKGVGLADFVDWQANRIAELESLTVTVENLQESAYRAGLTAGWNLGLANNNEGFNKCLAAHTAGFKVEAE